MTTVLVTALVMTNVLVMAYCKSLKFGGPLSLRNLNFQELADIYFGYFLDIPYMTKAYFRHWRPLILANLRPLSKLTKYNRR